MRSARCASPPGSPTAGTCRSSRPRRSPASATCCMRHCDDVGRDPGRDRMRRQPRPRLVRGQPPAPVRGDRRVRASWRAHRLARRGRRTASASTSMPAPTRSTSRCGRRSTSHALERFSRGVAVGLSAAASRAACGGSPHAPPEQVLAVDPHRPGPGERRRRTRRRDRRRSRTARSGRARGRDEVPRRRRARRSGRTRASRPSPGRSRSTEQRRPVGRLVDRHPGPTPDRDECACAAARRHRRAPCPSQGAGVPARRRGS